MYKHENRAILSLALIMVFRMLGLFMILPVFSVATATIAGATPKLIGFAIGAYGLTQALLQIPFGALSDKVGRKPIIILGLILFIIGSIVAAASHSISGIIIGRAIQGGGAIGSTVMALLSDLTRDEGRTKAMAVMGLSIGCAFSIALVLGTLLNHLFGLSGIFIATAVFGVIGILLLLIVPKAPKIVVQRKQSMLVLLRDPSLIRLDFSIFSLHAILTALFIALPIVFDYKLNMSSEHIVVMYLAVLVIAFIGATYYYCGKTSMVKANHAWRHRCNCSH
jgi:MFS family permease